MSKSTINTKDSAIVDHDYMQLQVMFCETLMLRWIVSLPKVVLHVGLH